MQSTPSYLISVRYIFNIILPSLPRLSEVAFLQDFRPLFVSMSDTAHACWMPHLIIRDVIILIIFDRKCNLWSFALHSFLEPPFASVNIFSSAWRTLIIIKRELMFVTYYFRVSGAQLTLICCSTCLNIFYGKTLSFTILGQRYFEKGLLWPICQ
jgi:hypothetical protein